MDKNISDQQIESSIENILIEYDQNIEVYKEFEIYMKDLLHEIFNNTNIKIRFTESDFISYLKNTEMRYGNDAQYFYKIINNCYNRMLLIDKYNLQEKV